MIFKLDKKGLDTVLLPWQAELMKLIWSNGGEIDSRTAHNRLRNSTTPVSRASTINFLDKMTEEGLLDYRETTTKGGWKRIYRPSLIAPDEEGFRKALADRIFERVRTELLGDTSTGVDQNPLRMPPGNPSPRARSEPTL
jgi:hypothetical protein